MDKENANHCAPTIAIGAKELFELYRNSSRKTQFSLTESDHINPQYSQYIDGKYCLCQFNNDGLIGVRDLEVLQDFTTSTQLNDMLSFEYVLSGGSDVELNQQSLHNNGVPRFYIASHKSGGRQTRMHKKGEKVQGVGLWLKPELLTDYFQLDISQLEPPLKHLFSFQCDKALSFALTTPIKETLKAMINMPLEGHLSSLFLQSKATELLCYTFNSLVSSAEELSTGFQLSKHKAKAIGLVIQSINHNLASPPSIDELALHVGLSRSNLLATFKSSCGMSYSNYLNQQRMESAQSLIMSGRSNILDAALSVGYNDQSAFSRAYKRYFKHPPKADRP